MSTSTVFSHGSPVEVRGRSPLRAAPGLTGRYAGEEAANDATLPRSAPHGPVERLAQVPMPNLGISAWYAISGTAMA
jgi:hypothetical protein